MSCKWSESGDLFRGVIAVSQLYLFKPLNSWELQWLSWENKLWDLNRGKICTNHRLLTNFVGKKYDGIISGKSVELFVVAFSGESSGNYQWRKSK